MPLGPHLPKRVPRMRGAAVSRSPLCPSVAGAHLYDAHVPARTCACRCMQCMPACVCMCTIVYVHGKCVCLCVCVLMGDCTCGYVQVCTPVDVHRCACVYFCVLWTHGNAKGCVHSCLHVCVWRYVCTRICLCLCSGADRCVHTCTCACVCMSMPLCARAHLWTCPCFCPHACLCVCPCT